MTTIDLIEVVPFRIPLRGEVRFAAGVLRAADHVLVRITDSDGAVGVAEAIPRPMIYGETVGSIVSAYSDVVCPIAVGRRIWDFERLHEDLQSLLRNETAKAAFELALLDLVGHHLQTPVCRLQGGYAEALPVSAILGYGEPEAVAEEALAYQDELGIMAFKLKVGGNLQRDIEICERLRQVVGDAALLYVDANHGYDGPSALRFCRSTRDVRLAWIEEPCPADQVLDRERVAAMCGLPVLADESVVSPGDVAREVLGRRAHMVSLKVARSGWRDSDRIRGFCETAGVPLVMGSQGDSGVGTLSALGYAAAFRSTSRYPAEYSYFLHMGDDLLREPLVVDDGQIHVPEEPGFGIHIDDEKLNRYRIDL